MYFHRRLIICLSRIFLPAYFGTREIKLLIVMDDIKRIGMQLIGYVILAENIKHIIFQKNLKLPIVLNTFVLRLTIIFLIFMYHHNFVRLM